MIYIVKGNTIRDIALPLQLLTVEQSGETLTDYYPSETDVIEVYMQGTCIKEAMEVSVTDNYLHWSWTPTNIGCYGIEVMITQADGTRMRSYRKDQVTVCCANDMLPTDDGIVEFVAEYITLESVTVVWVRGEPGQDADIAAAEAATNAANAAATAANTAASNADSKATAANTAATAANTAASNANDKADAANTAAGAANDAAELANSKAAAANSAAELANTKAGLANTAATAANDAASLANTKAGLANTAATAANDAASLANTKAGLANTAATAANDAASLANTAATAANDAAELANTKAGLANTAATAANDAAELANTKAGLANTAAENADDATADARAAIAALTPDATPTEGSTNTVMSGGVYSAIPEVVNSLNSSDTDKALSANQGKILNESKQDTLTFDNAPTDGSSNPVTSGGVYTSINALDEQINGADTNTEIFDEADYYAEASGRYIKSDGGISTKSQYTIRKYELGLAEKVQVTTRVEGTTIYAVAFYTDKDSTSASKCISVHTVTPDILATLTLNVPTGAEAMVVHFLTEYASSLAVSGYVVTHVDGIAQNVLDIDSRLESVETKVSEVIYGYCGLLSRMWKPYRVNYFTRILDTVSPSVGNQLNPRFCGSSVVPDDTYRSYVIKVSAADTYTVNAYSTSAVNAIVILDENLFIIGKYADTLGGSEYNITIPSNGAWMIVHAVIGQDYTTSVSGVDLTDNHSWSSGITPSAYHYKSRFIDYQIYEYNWMQPIASRYKWHTQDLTAIGLTDYNGWVSVAIRDNTTGIYTIHALSKRNEDDHNPCSVDWDENGTLICGYASGHGEDQYFHVAKITNAASLDADITTYDYDMGDGYNTTYSQYFKVGDYMYFFVRCSTVGMSVLKVSVSDPTTYSTYNSGVSSANYWLINKVTDRDGIYRVVLYSNPETSNNKIYTCLIDMASDDLNIYDSSETLICNFSSIGSNIGNLDVLVETNLTYDSLRLFSASTSPLNELTIAYARFNLAAYDGAYYILRDGSEIGVGSCGDHWYHTSHYLPGMAISPVNRDYFVYSVKDGDCDLVGCEVQSGNSLSKTLLKKSAEWIIRPTWVKNDETNLITAEGKVTADTDQNFRHLAMIVGDDSVHVPF